MIIGSLSTLGQESSGPISPLGMRVGARVNGLRKRVQISTLEIIGNQNENNSLFFSLGFSLFLSEFSASKIRPTLGFSSLGIFGFSLKNHVSLVDEWSWLFISKGWPAINQGRKNRRDFPRNERFLGKREALRETKSFCERRKVSRETKGFTRKPRSLSSR